MPRWVILLGDVRGIPRLSGFGCWTSFFFFSSRRRHTRLVSDWSSDVCSSDLRPRRRDEHHVAVRRRLCNQIDADVAVRPRPALHHERRAEGLAEILGERAREEIHRPSRRARRDDAHRVARPGRLRARGERKSDSGKKEWVGEHRTDLRWGSESYPSPHPSGGKTAPDAAGAVLNRNEP